MVVNNKLLFLCVSAVVCATLVSGCTRHRSGAYYKDDGPPAKSRVDIAAIADAVPRPEPRATTGNKPYKALGKHYVPLASARGYRKTGKASWYGRKFHGRRTSSGEPYDMFAMTAAHPTLPLPTYVRVTHLDNARSVVVKVNDRGPFLGGRILDLSYAAAAKLGIVEQGTGRVRVSAITDFAPTATSSATATGSIGRAPRASTPVSTDSKRYFLQAGAFGDALNAKALQYRLVALGYPSATVYADTTSQGRLFRVRIGPVDGLKRASGRAHQLAQHLGTAPRIIALHQ